MNDTEQGYVISAVVSTPYRKSSILLCYVLFEIELCYHCCGINVCVFQTDTLTRAPRLSFGLLVQVNACLYCHTEEDVQNTN